MYKRHLIHGLHKLVLFFKAILAPEVIAVEGLQEWSQARRMVDTCMGLTAGRLKLIHAFYIGMLALRYRTPRGEKIIWPNQYTWLLEQGLIEWKDHTFWGMSEESIRDKSDADTTVKLLALAQVSWFVGQSIMRRAHHLPLSPLETMTISYIPLVAITYFFCWVKPKDVMTPSVVDLPDMAVSQMSTFESLAVSNAFDTEGLGKQNSLWTVWDLTPRVFEKEARDKAVREAERMHQHEAAIKQDSGPETQSCAPDVEIGAKTKVKRSAEAVEVLKKFDEETVVAYWDPELYNSKFLWPFICLFAASFPALHLICWYTVFPTLVEQWLWRAAALISIFSMLVFIQFEKTVLQWGGPLTMISIVSPVLYLLSRLVMMAGVLAAFRASDPAIYETYTVSTYWIHIF